MNESVSSILASPLDGPQVKGETSAPPAEPTEAKVETETKAEKARDEGGRFKATESEPKETSAIVEQKDDDKSVAQGINAALLAERTRRRELEAKLREFQSQPPKPAEKVSIFEDEDKALDQRISTHLRPLREQNFNLSVELARSKHGDEYVTAEAAFFEAAEADPRLYDQLRAVANPGEHILAIGTQLAELGPVGGDFRKWREKATADLKGELSKRDEQIKALTAQVESLTKSQKQLESIPRSLNRGSESLATTSVDPPDINEIVRFKTG